MSQSREVLFRPLFETQLDSRPEAHAPRSEHEMGLLLVTLGEDDLPYRPADDDVDVVRALRTALGNAHLPTPAVPVASTLPRA